MAIYPNEIQAAHKVFQTLVRLKLENDDPIARKNFVESWIRTVNQLDTVIGCTDDADHQILIFLIEACKALCGMEHHVAQIMINEALQELTKSNRRG